MPVTRVYAACCPQVMSAPVLSAAHGFSVSFMDLRFTFISSHVPHKAGKLTELVSRDRRALSGICAQYARIHNCCSHNDSTASYNLLTLCFVE